MYRSSCVGLTAVECFGSASRSVSERGTASVYGVCLTPLSDFLAALVSPDIGEPVHSWAVTSIPCADALPRHDPQIKLGDETMSVLEIWGAEYQENDCILIKQEDRGTLEAICARERCLMQARLPRA